MLPRTNNGLTSSPSSRAGRPRWNDVHLRRRGPFVMTDDRPTPSFCHVAVLRQRVQRGCKAATRMQLHDVDRRLHAMCVRPRAGGRLVWASEMYHCLRWGRFRGHQRKGSLSLMYYIVVAHKNRCRCLPLGLLLL